MGRARIAVRAPTAASRRVVVKVHVAPLRAGGAKAAALHVRYIERDGVEKDGSKGQLYGPSGLISTRDFEAPRRREKHQFRLVVSPEDAGELDLTAYVRRFMATVERDTGRKLEWGAVNHFDTEHPHAHVIIRGVDRDGREVRFDRAYVAHGLRERAQELATEELGPRPMYDVARQRAREVTQERLTTLDRDLAKRAVGDGVELRLGLPEGRARQNESLLVGRLRHLEELRLAERVSASAWTLVPGWQEHLRELGTRGDIIKEMHRALQADPARYQIVKAGQHLAPDPTHASPVVHGRVAKKGLADELRGAFYAVIETPSGGGYYVPLDQRSANEVREGDWVVLSTKPKAWRRVEDEEIERMARGNAGVYEARGVQMDERGDARVNRLDTPGGGEVEPKGPRAESNNVDVQHQGSHPGNMQGGTPVDRGEAHRRRLVELEKLGLVARAGEDRWAVQPGLVARLDEKDRLEPRYQLRLEREPLRLEEQVRHLGPVWLDRVESESFAPYGLGAELRRAVARREEVLRGAGIDPSDPKKLARLRDLERRTLGKQIAAETGAEFVEQSPATFRGRVHVRERADSIAYAEVNDGRRFVLAPVNRELRALNGRTAVLSRDAKGRLQVRAAERDRDRGDR